MPGNPGCVFCGAVEPVRPLPPSPIGAAFQPTPAARGSRRRLQATFVLLVSLSVVLVASRGAGPTSLPGEDGRPVAAVGPWSDPMAYGSPATPQPFNVPGWDVAVHIRNNYQYGGIDAMQAQHGPDCGAPPATHPISSYVDAVFVCKNHVMTAMNAGGYGVIYLTPDHMIDFSRGTSSLTYAVSTFRTSDRDWIDIWVTPFAENLELPLDSWLPDLQGPPKDAVHIRMGEFNQQTNFGGEVYHNFQSQGLPSNWWTTEESFLKVSQQVRGRYELDISRTHIRFGMPDYGVWWIDTNVPDLGFSQGVVQFGHHSYTPTKSAGCGPPPEQKALGLGCQPNTWHWSNFSMSSAVPFTLIKARERRVWAGSTTTATFPQPAPANAFLRFAGVGVTQVSFDGGRSWQAPRLQPESKHVGGAFENYFTPVPAGTAAVMFRGQNWYGGPWFARDLSIWSPSAPMPGLPTPSPSSTPSSTPTFSPTPTASPRTPGRAGINIEPSMRPWRYSGANPDGWWDPGHGIAAVNAEMPLIQRLGVQTVRLEFPWPLIEPQRGVFDWSRSDYIVNSASAHGVHLQPVLVFTPAWAGPSATSAPSSADFRTFVSAVVGRYHNSVHYWEMWNEPDHFHYWTASEAAYVQNIVIPGYQAAKAADPKAQVILAGPAGWSSSWFDGVFANGGGGFFDIVAYHDYGGTPQQTAYGVQAAERAHGLSLPIWLGEYGIQQNSVHDTSQQALMTAVLTSTAPIAMAQWYNLRDDYSMTCCPAQVMVAAYWGLVQHDDITLKDGFFTMQALAAGRTSGSAGVQPPTPSSTPGREPTPTARTEPTPIPSERK